jgi:hypothetical protein
MLNKIYFFHVLIWFNFIFSYFLLHVIAVGLQVIIIGLLGSVASTDPVFVIFGVGSKFVNKCFLIGSDRLLVWEKSTTSRPIWIS